jgi:hypothetical protein
MRVLMRVQLETAAGNEAVKSGKVEEIVGRAMERLKPEAAYFLASGGVRTALFVFDMTDASQIPAFTEPFWQGANADVEIMPVMNADDLRKGFAALEG